MKDSPNLDLLRALAVILVVVSHVGLNLGWSRGYFDIQVIGRVGVAIFFVHTCLVLMMSLERHDAGAAAFLIRRAFRIYPLAIVIVLCVTAMLWLWGGRVEVGVLISNILLVQNITGTASVLDPLWSLPYEVQMYLFLPALFVLMRSPHALLWIVLLWTGSVAAVGLAPARSMHHQLLQYLPCFLPGVVAYVLGRRSRATSSPVVMFVPVALSIVAIPALVSAGVPEIPLLWALCVALGMAIPACRQIASAPLAAAAKTVAKFSYGIYLTHMLAILVAFVILGKLPQPVQWLAFCVVLAALSIAGYRWIEAPGIRLGMRLAAAAPRAASPLAWRWVMVRTRPQVSDSEPPTKRL